MARTSKFTVVTNRNDPALVKMFATLEDAQAYVGPEYDKKGFVVTTFEKKTETYFAEVVEEKEESALEAMERAEREQELLRDAQIEEDRRARLFVRD